MGCSVGLSSVTLQISALVPELTRDYNERTVAGGWRVLIGNFIGMVSVVLHSLIAGDGSPEQLRYSAAMCAGLMLVISWTVFAGIEERFEIQQASVQVSFLTELTLCMQNRPFRYVALIYLCGPCAVVLVQSNMVMFCNTFCETRTLSSWCYHSCRARLFL